MLIHSLTHWKVKQQQKKRQFFAFVQVTWWQSRVVVILFGEWFIWTKRIIEIRGIWIQIPIISRSFTWLLLMVVWLLSKIKTQPHSLSLFFGDMTQNVHVTDTWCSKVLSRQLAYSESGQKMVLEIICYCWGGSIQKSSNG